MKILRNKKGVTLFTLVVSIIILLILAAVAISLTIGTDGILNRATSSVEKSKIKIAKEEAENLILKYNTFYYEDRNENHLKVGSLKKYIKGKIGNGKNIGDFILKYDDETERIEVYENDSENAIPIATGDIDIGDGTVLWDGSVVSSSVALFDPVEWDSVDPNAESCFVWKSNDENDGEDYHTVIGYTSNIDNRTILRIPSRCHSIELSDYGEPDGHGGRSFVKNIKEVQLPKTITNIGNSAFSNNYDCINGFIELEKIIIPRSVTSIGNYAFQDCRNLTDIFIPNTITSIGNMAFCGCKELTEITLPNSVTSIGNGAFRDCEKLTDVILSNRITSIGNSTFSSCENLEGIIIPDNVTSIGNNAFYGCSKIREIVVPNGVSNIEQFTFWECSSLESITIPKSVTNICSNAFNDCTSLTTVNYTGTQSEWESINIEFGNDALINATINYNYTGE